jgi:hypothetical protein
MLNDKMSKMSRQKLLQVVIGLTLIMLFLVGCGTTAPTPVSEAPAASPTPEPPTATPSPEPPTATPSPEPPTPTEEPKPEETVVTTEEPGADGPRTGDVAPDFNLPDSNGDMVHLADEVQDNRMVVLVFYEVHT